MKNCIECNAEFNEKGHKKFCSDKCRNRFHKPINATKIKNCKSCDTKFETRHPNHIFCSHQCFKKLANKKARIITKMNNMNAINRLINWLEENKDLKISIEHIKLQAEVFALEESLNINYFESVTNIFNKKTNENEPKEQRSTSVSN